MEKHVNRKKLIIGWVMLIVIFVIITIIGALFIEGFLVVWFPISAMIAIMFQALSHHFIEIDIPCPNCGTLNNMESENCVKCGIQLTSDANE